MLMFRGRIKTFQQIPLPVLVDFPVSMMNYTSLLDGWNVSNPAELNKTLLANLFSNCTQLVRPGEDDVEINFSNRPLVVQDSWLARYIFFFDVIFVGIVVIAGIAGNILSCFVLLRDRSHGTTNLILISLAIFDTLFLIVCLFFQVLRGLSNELYWIEYINFYPHSSKFLYGFGMAFRMMRNWTVVLVTVERWVAVCNPLRAPSICTRSKAYRAIVSIVLLSILYNIPHFFIVMAIELVCHGSADSGQAILIFHSLRQPWVDKNYAFQLGYRIIGYTIIIVFLPTFIIGVLNILLIRGIRYANKRRAQIIVQVNCASRQLNKRCSASKSENSDDISCQAKSGKLEHSNNNNANTKNEHHSHFLRVEKSTRSRTNEVNRLCIGVIMIYLICELPAVGYQVIHALNDQKHKKIARPITSALVCLNSGVNFFVYVFLGRRFRSQLKLLLRRLYYKLCFCCAPHKRPDDEARYYRRYHPGTLRIPAHHNHHHLHRPKSNVGSNANNNTIAGGLTAGNCLQLTSTNNNNKSVGQLESPIGPSGVACPSNTSITEV